MFPENSRDSHEYLDFSMFVKKAKSELKKVYYNEFRISAKFNELVSELVRNEIEYKFLE